MLTAFPDVRQEMFSGVKSELEASGMLSERLYHRPRAVIINELLKKGSISSKAYYKLVDPYTGDKMLETNLFAYHIRSEKISFQSTVVKRYCEENAAEWEENELEAR